MNHLQAARTRASALLGGLRHGASRMLAFLLRHKIAATAFILAAILGITALWVLRPRRDGLPAASGEGYTRTVTLERGTLEDSISATGTVESAQVSTVTTDLKYTVKEVLVQVGDSVKEGDVICVLDSSELETSIQKLKENLAETQADALEQYEDAQEALTESQEKVTDTYDAMEVAEDDLEEAEEAYNKAASTVNPYQSKVDAANSALLSALNTLNSAQAALDQAKTAYDKVAASVGSESGDAAETDPAYTQAKTNLENAQGTYNAAEDAYKKAQEALSEAQSQLQTAQSTTGYTSLSSAYTQAQTAYDQAETTYENAITTAEAAEETRDKALENYNKSGESDELEELEDQLDKCTLKAQTSGKVTALNATVGSAVEGAAATIQDTSQLVISITIAEYDIENVSEGMKAVITSDVIDGEISGTLTQISPTASGGGSSSSSFSAQVTVDSTDSGLLIGTNASVEIIQSTTEDVFIVPLDAIEEQEDGTSVIYVQADGSQEEDYSPVPVTVGATNDYYAQISGDDLKEGMVVKASVLDETISQETSGESGGSDFSISMGGMGGSFAGGGGGPTGGGMGGGPMGG